MSHGRQTTGPSVGKTESGFISFMWAAGDDIKYLRTELTFYCKMNVKKTEPVSHW